MTYSFPLTELFVQCPATPMQAMLYRHRHRHLHSTTLPHRSTNPLPISYCDRQTPWVFRVKKAILAEASPVFDDMFSLPSPQTEDSNSGTCDLPVLPLEEDSRTLESLLRLCYPVDQMPLRTLDQASMLLEVARKYIMDGALRFLGQRLLTFAVASPVQVFALAVRSELEHDVVLAAARASLNFFLLDESQRGEEIRHISAAAYLSLLDFRQRCARAAGSVFDDYDWIAADKWCWTTCPLSSTCPFASKNFRTGPLTDRNYGGQTRWMATAVPCTQDHPERSLPL